MSDDGSTPLDVGELFALVERLDDDNEHLRQRNLEVLRWMEEAVTAQVAGERRIAELDGQNIALTGELDAIRSSFAWRTLMPIRSAYARVRKARPPR